MLHLRTLNIEDLPQAMRLKDQADWNQTEADWRRFLAMEPDGCFAAEEEGRVIGTAATTVFGPVGWVAMVLVDAERRGCGIGTRLVERAIDYLQDRGVETMRLDATPLGEPLYRRLGFRAEYQLVRWEGSAPAATTSVTVHGDCPNFRGGDDIAPRNELCRRENGTVPFGSQRDKQTGRKMSQSPAATFRQCEAIRPDELCQAAELDARITGTARLRLFEYLDRQQPGALRGVRTRGELVAYFTFRHGSRATQLGPGAALDPAAGRLLAEEALQACAGRIVYIDIPVGCAPANDWAQGYGLSVQRHLLRMSRGEPIHDHPDQLWASSGPENG